MQRYFRYIKDYFNLNRTEQRGLIILFSLLLLIVLSNFILPFLIKDEPVNSALFEEKVIAFEKKQKVISDSIRKQREKYVKSQKQNDVNQLMPFPFDPNNLSTEKWKELGLSDFQVKMIKNYELKGGSFNKASDLAKIYSISDQEFAILEPYIQIMVKKSYAVENKNSPALTPVLFNPNTASADDFANMGFNQKLIGSIVNYRNKGGFFRIKEDMKKIYSLPEEDYFRLEPFILLPERIAINEKPEQIALSVEINSADTLDLQQIPGIGPSFARRIVKYRSMLGGYYKIEQLMEVYGMDSVRYAGIYNHLVFDQSLITKINVNTASIKELIKHPYIEFYLAKSILTFREEKGGISTTDELKNIRLMYDELFYKIQPYLKLKEPSTKNENK